MVSVFQKYGFYIVKVWFLFFECCVVAIRQQHYWQAVSSCRGRFIVPVYTCSPYFRKTLGHIWQSVSNIIGMLLAAVGADLSCPHIYIRHAFAIRLKHIYVMFATCSLSVCYIFAVQKYGFCVAKVWFLACKNYLFGLQKPPF